MNDATHIAIPKKAFEEALAKLNHGPRSLVQPIFDLVSQGYPITLKPKVVDEKEDDGEPQTG